jgi:hypothetical protein
MQKWFFIFFISKFESTAFKLIPPAVEMASSIVAAAEIFNGNFLMNFANVGVSKNSSLVSVIFIRSITVRDNFILPFKAVVMLEFEFVSF